MSAETSAVVTLRPIRDDDRDFLRRLYASTREGGAGGGDRLERRAEGSVLTQQFEAQHHHYQTYYAEASFDLVLEHGEPMAIAMPLLTPS